MAWPRKGRTPRQRGLAEGYRSGLEEVNAEVLRKHGIPVEFEMYFIRYTVPAREAKYTPDFLLANGIIVETKGRFVTADRTKHRHLNEQYPDLDIRFVFSRPTDTIGKKSKTTYADWCNRMGIRWAAKTIPAEWLREKPTKARMDAAKKYLISKSKE